MSGALGLGLGTAPSNEAKNLSNALNREKFVAEVEAELREQTAAAAAAKTNSIKSTPNKAQFIIFTADEGTKIV